MVNAKTELADESVLVARALTEPEAFASLYDHYFARVYNYIRYRVGNAQTADDLTAQVFERTLTKIGSYRAEQAPFGAWLFSIARHIVGDHFRAHKRRTWLPFDLLKEHASDESLPEEIAADNEELTRLLIAVASLKERERDIIALKFGAGLTNHRIAQLTGLSESNIGVILYRALRQLKAALSDEE